MQTCDGSGLEAEVSSKRKNRIGERLQIRTGEPQSATAFTIPTYVCDHKVVRYLRKVKARQPERRMEPSDGVKARQGPCPGGLGRFGGCRLDRLMAYVPSKWNHSARSAGSRTCPPWCQLARWHPEVGTSLQVEATSRPEQRILHVNVEITRAGRPNNSHHKRSVNLERRST